ncbi:MAG: endonuclease/exonuclease/phosphatase family protein [Candidatus Sungbacteria bacterium]|nr:endonuclease/exonuclease/phosphatase family protein [Candidatus Sungbacteria bacterium]
MPAISLISLNIERDKHLDRVLPFLSDRMPEVACIQELFEDDARALSDALKGASYVFAPMTQQENMRGNMSVRGIGIFSRLPIRQQHIAYYRGHSTHVAGFDSTSTETKSKTQNHAVLLCDLEKDGAVFTVGTTHFTWTPDGKPDEYQRIDLEAMLRELREYDEFVLAGDFNAPRGGEIFTVLAERYKDNIPAKYVTSLDVALHHVGKLRPQELADKMVDGVFSTPGLKVSDVELHTGISDHCAITATISKSE